MHQANSKPKSFFISQAIKSKVVRELMRIEKKKHEAGFETKKK
jgi:hypothetical protein